MRQIENKDNMYSIKYRLKNMANYAGVLKECPRCHNKTFGYGFIKKHKHYTFCIECLYKQIIVK